MGDKQHVAKFLLDVAGDPEKHAAWKEDPKGTMTAAGIDDEDQKVLMSGDLQQVRTHLGEDDPPGCILLMI